MAKVCMVQRDLKREKLAKKFEAKRTALKAKIMSKESTIEERFEAQLQMNSLPRNSSASRKRNRCQVTGRPRGYYRKFKMSRISLRELAAYGMIPGLVKSSW